MEIFFYILIIIFITWFLTHGYFYSPKVHIKRLWKEIFKISYKIGRQKKEYRNSDSVVNGLVADSYEKAIYKREKMINALLDYYFDPEKDQEYIEENRPKNRK